MRIQLVKISALATVIGSLMLSKIVIESAIGLDAVRPGLMFNAHVLHLLLLVFLIISSMGVCLGFACALRFYVYSLKTAFIIAFVWGSILGIFAFYRIVPTQWTEVAKKTFVITMWRSSALAFSMSLVCVLFTLLARGEQRPRKQQEF